MLGFICELSQAIAVIAGFITFLFTGAMSALYVPGAIVTVVCLAIHYVTIHKVIKQCREAGEE